MSAASDPSALPLLDAAALTRLEEELGDAKVARAFARDFAMAAAKRFRSLSDAVGSGDQAAAVDSVLSLKASSLMVGASRLAGLAARLERVIRDGELDTAVGALDEVRACSNATVSELLTGYLGR